MALAIDTRSYRTPNYDAREEPISALVLHTGEGTRKSDLHTLTYRHPNPQKRVSSGYYVCRDGTVYQLADDNQVTWHAGISFYLGLANWNNFSIGIETEHKQGQDWPRIQVDALADLCGLKIGQYRIRQQMVVAHRWIAPSRKIDPTNWPDSELKPWIAALYQPVNDADERQREWGTIPVNFAWGIPTRWWQEQNGDRPLGKAITPEVYPVPGYSVQYFERGAILYRASDGKLAVGRYL